MIGRSWSVERLLTILRMGLRVVCDTSSIPKTHFLFRLHAGPILPRLYCQTLFGIHIGLIHGLCNSIYLGVQNIKFIVHRWIIKSAGQGINHEVYYLFSYFSLSKHRQLNIKHHVCSQIFMKKERLNVCRGRKVLSN